jgi:inner membrane protein
MPSPVGHALAGLIIHVATARNGEERRDRPRALVAVAAATAPDLDLVLSLFDGHNHHQGFTHSVLAALAAGVLAGIATVLLGQRGPVRWAWLVSLAWGSHLLLDFLGRDTSPPIGIPLLWPARLYFHCPWSLFLDVGRTLKWATVRHNAVALACEIVLLVPILAFTYRWCARRTA